MEASEAPDIWRSCAVIERNRESVCKKKPAAIRSQRNAGTGIPKMSIFSQENKSCVMCCSLGACFCCIFV
jgi:hypothetical protein